MNLTCSDFTYLEYTRIAVGNFDKVPKLADIHPDDRAELKSRLVQEFQELTGDNSYRNYKQLHEDLHRFADQYDKYAVLYNLMLSAGEQALKEFYSIFDEFKIKYKETDSFEVILQRVFARMKKPELQYKSIEKQIKTINEKNKDKPEVSETDLLKIVASISTGLMFSVSVNDNAVVVAEYINILNKRQDSYGK